MEQVKSFAYLGNIVTVDGATLEGVRRRIKKANGPWCSCTQFGGVKISYLELKFDYLIQMLSQSYRTGVKRGK